MEAMRKGGAEMAVGPWFTGDLSAIWRAKNCIQGRGGGHSGEETKRRVTTLDSFPMRLPAASLFSMGQCHS